MKQIMSHVEREAKIVNQPDLIKKIWTVADTFELYHTVKHLFMLHLLRVGKKIQYETIPWKTYYNIFPNGKGE